MIHEMGIESVPFGRVAMGEITARVVQHDKDYQVGDELHLFELEGWGARKTHYQERNAKGHFVRTHVDNAPQRVEITHVLSALHCDGLLPGKVLLSFALLED